MYYKIENDKQYPATLEEIETEGHRLYWGITGYDTIEAVKAKFGIGEKVFPENPERAPMSYENHECFDFICLHVLNPKSLAAPMEHLCVYMRKNVLLFICKDVKTAAKRMEDFLAEDGKSISFDRVLSTFFERMTAHNATYMEKMEREVSDLEDALITSKKRDCVKEIVSLRKRLMVLKRYYEQLLDVLDEMMENENELLHNRSQRYFKIFQGRVDRMYHSVLNLRDYVTQVREAYQAEVDISLNNIMRIFTVITAVFLPLTLIVGWYGMNLQMPELKWPFAYPMVILLSILVVVFCLLFFKKKKWF